MLVILFCQPSVPWHFWFSQVQVLFAVSFCGVPVRLLNVINVLPLFSVSLNVVPHHHYKKRQKKGGKHSKCFLVAVQKNNQSMFLWFPFIEFYSYATAELRIFSDKLFIETYFVDMQSFFKICLHSPAPQMKKRYQEMNWLTVPPPPHDLW